MTCNKWPLKVYKRWENEKSKLSAGGVVAAGAPSVCTPANGYKKKIGNAPIPGCTGCGTIITSEVRALQCDRCVKDDRWICIECLGISGEVYDALIECKELSWFCQECSEQVPKGKEEREDKVVGLLEKVLDRLGNLEDRLYQKVDVKTFKELEERVRRVEDDVKERVDEKKERIVQNDAKVVQQEVKEGL